MIEHKGRIVGILISFSWITVLLVVLVPPLTYLYVGYERAQGGMEAGVSISTRLVSRLVNANPDLWQFEDTRIIDLLNDARGSKHDDIYRVFDNSGKIVAQVPAEIVPSVWPSLTSEETLYSYGQSVGRLSVEHSMEHLYITTLSIGIVSMVVGFFFHLGLRHLPVASLTRAWKQINYLASNDDLTGLPNRTSLKVQLEDYIKRTKGEKTFAVMFLDLDRFKIINDTLGHSVGDGLLKNVAERLRSCIREGDIVARLGGDEFAVVQMSDRQPNEATVLAKRICEEMAKPFDLGENRVVIGASVGIAIAPLDGENTDILLKNADLALYRAKSDGRGVHRFFESGMDALMQERRQMEFELRLGLEREEFELHYQPQVDLVSGKIVGFEALLRWNHPQRGLLAPDLFIPLAEETALIIPIGEWVIRTACMQASSWPFDTNMAVNLSPVQFRSDDLVRTVFSALANSGIAAKRLELEITEKILLLDNEATLKTLHGLRDLGVRIAMDDFGTGYSSLSYLRSFPFDKLKIDRSFVSDFIEGGSDGAIVSAVASMSKSLGIETTAEGVETEAQLEMVTTAGYTQMQGYLFSQPVSGAEISRKYFSGKDPDQVMALPA
tara:strand:+ start:142306 stop:144138 length:1833 start_codon:yes stop_codon:yes gene_type:complete